MRRALFLIALLPLVAADARADSPPDPPPAAAPIVAAPPPTGAPVVPEVARRDCFANLERFTWKRGQEPPASAGLDYLTGLKACDDLLATAVERAVDFRVHEREARVFARQKKFVMAAYAVLWGVLIVFVVAAWLRQQKLNGKLADLEAKLRAAEAEQKKSA